MRCRQYTPPSNATTPESNKSVLGTGEDYSEEELKPLHSLPAGARSCVGELGIIDWLGHLAAVDYLIAPEGLATFFALSQRVPALVVFKETLALLRMPQEWRNNAICVRPQVVDHGEAEGRWIPLDPQQTATLVLARFDPEAA